MDDRLLGALMKLKYRKINDNFIISNNRDLIAVIKYFESSDITQIRVYEKLPSNFVNVSDIKINTLKGNRLGQFAAISDEDYILNRLEVEI